MMEANSWKQKQFDILCGLRDICAAHSIGMFLYGETALAAYRDGVLSDDVRVCVDAKDAAGLIEAVSGDPEGRFGIEGMHNNGSFPAFELRVYDPATIDFNANNFMQYRNNCIHVAVELIEHVPKSKLTARRLDLEYGLYKDRNKLRQKKASAGSQNRLKMFLIGRMDRREKKLGAEAVSAGLFRMLADGYAGPEGKVRVGKTGFAKDTFGSTSETVLEGETFALPGQPEKYLRKLFGPNWKNTACTEYEETSAKFRDADISWADYEVRIRDIDFDDFEANMKKNNALRREYKVYNDAVHHYYDILRRTDERIKLWQKYEPEKEKIMELAAKGDTEALASELEEYLDALDRFHKLGLGLCFDMDIFGAAKAVLAARGEEEYAAELEALIPEVHRQPLHIMDYKGNIIA